MKPRAKGGATLFWCLRWLGRIGVLTGLIFAGIGACAFTALGGIGPDSHPSFSLLWTPFIALYFVIVLSFYWAATYYWISIPFLSLAGIDILWRLQPKPRQTLWSGFLDCHTVSLTLLLATIILTWTTTGIYLERYFNRSGPAHFSIENRSGQTLEHVEWKAESGSIEVGRLLPWERKYYEFLPKSKKEKVSMTIGVGGISKNIDFTGGIENTREYYEEFGVDKNLRGEFNAWEARSTGASRVDFTNESAKELKNVEINGLGWKIDAATLAPGAHMTGNASPQGPMLFTISYEADGKRFAFDLGRSWGFEGKNLWVHIPSNLVFTPNEMADFGFDNR